MDEDYPHLHRFASAIGMSPDNLVQAFRIEQAFHERILQEADVEKRKLLYRRVYAQVHAIYGKTTTQILQGRNPKDRSVRLFRRELEGRSILDVGCGEGYFLASVARQLNHKTLVGVDVSIPAASRRHPDIEFIESDIVEFDLARQFDVVFSDQVLEHIAPADLDLHLGSVGRALKHGGTFVVSLPNRLFGPSDVTRIIDFSYTGRTPAQGTHLNESTYTALIPVLQNHGFRNFKTVLPIPVLRHVFGNCRMRGATLAALEGNRVAIGLLRSIKARGRCLVRLGVVLVCTWS